MGTPTANAGSDVVIDLGSGGTIGGGVSQVLDGSASSSTGGATISAYQWYLLDKPAGSSAALSSQTIVGPTLNSIDTWGTYRAFLVVTDSDGASSASNPLLAPDSAFVSVRVKSAATGLVKPAKGERNWHTYGQDHVQKIDDIQVALTNQTIAQHSDTTATGAELNFLTDTSYATSDGTSSGTSLHKHTGDQVDTATTGTKGTVFLHESASPAKVMVKAYGAFTGTADGTHTSSGYLPGVLTSQDSTVTHSVFHLAFRAHRDVTVREVFWTMRDGGTVAAGGYQIRVYLMSESAYLSNTLGTLIYDSGANQVPASDGAPMVGGQSSLSVTTSSARPMICVKIDSSQSSLADMGSGLTINIGWTTEP